MNTSSEPTRDDTITEESTVADAEQEKVLASTQEFTVVEARATKALVDAGVANAELFVREAVTMARLPGYNPHQQTSRVIAALDTVVALHTRKWPRLEDVPYGNVIEISLARLGKDLVRAVQIRVNGIDPDRLDDYARAMEAGDEFPPVIVFWNASTNHVFLADGFHRFEAALCVADRYTIPAAVYAGTQQDALEYAATCNATHGIPMTSADKRAAVGRLVTMHPDWSSRKIGRKVGCSPTTVGIVRKEHGLSVQNGQIESDRTVTRGDSTYKYTPPDKPIYAKIWELEHVIRDYLNGAVGMERTIETLASRIASLTAIRANHYRMPDTITLPEQYRKHELIQAVNNLLDQNRQAHTQLQESEDDEQKPQTPVPAATISQLASSLWDWLEARLAARGSRDTDRTERISLLEGIVANAFGVPDSLTLPEPYRDTAWISAVNRLLDQNREAHTQLQESEDDEQKSQAPVTYATQKELEIQLRDYLDCCGDRELGKELTKSELTTDIIFLESLISNDCHVPENMKMPEYYHRVDWVNAVLTVASEWRPKRFMLLNDNEDNVQKPRSPILPQPATPPQPQRATEDPHTLEPWKEIKRLLIDGDHDQLRTVLGTGAPEDLVTALGVVCTSMVLMHATRDLGIRVAQTLLDAIFLPWPEDEPEAPLPSAEASGNPTCPDCGGYIEARESNGDYIPVCSDCGAILGPAT